ncbi:rft protein [Cystoisospora suis]|uniref:Man(5)GlcNAc(2)-PP-dolichol translocation protein RFT1 n=1 Tax=Cystoisospora suis TaxID=483139 RepID=A0A2C6L6G6_9APIC|nr:rft protein [Cystoisospora suis]
MAEDIMGRRTRLKEKKSQFVSPRTHDETHSLPHVPPAVDTPEVSPCHHLQGLALSPFLFQLSSKLLSVGSSILLSRCFGLPSEILAIALFYLPTLQSSSLFVLREAARRTAFRIPSSKLKKEDTSSERGEFLVRRGREKEEEGEQDRSGIKRSVDILQPLDSPLIKKRYLSSPARLHSYSRHHPQLEFDSLDGWVDSTEATRQHETQKEEEEILHNPIPFPEYKPTEDQEKQVTCFSQSKVPDRSLPLRAFRHVPPSIERPNCYDRKPFLSSSPFSPRSRSSFVSPSCDLFSRDENLRSSLNLSYLGFLFSSILVLFLGIIWLSVHPTLQTERESKTSEGLLSKTVTTDGSSPHEELEAYAFLWSYRIAVLLFILATLIEASCEPLLISLLLSPSSLSDPALHKKSPSLSYDLVSKEKSFSKEEEEKEERREVSTGREQFFSYAGVYPCLSEEASVSRGDLLGCHRKSNKTDKTGYGETVRDEEKENRQRKDSETLRIGERDRPREEEENSRCIDRTNKRASTYRAMAEAASVTTRLLCILALITLQHFLKTFFLFPSDQEEEKKTLTHLDRREGEGRERNEQVEEKSVTSSYPLCNDQDFASSSSSSFSSFSPCRSSSSSRRLFRSSKIDDDSSVFTSCRGQEGGELHSGVHTQHSSCVHPVSPLLLPFQEATRAAFSSESWVIEVGKLLCVQPLLAFGMAQVTYSLVWMVVLGRASRDLHRGGEEEEDRGKERGGFGSPNLSFRQHFRNIQGRKDFEFRRQTTGEGVRREGEMKGHKEEEEESCAYEKSLKKESFVMFIWHFHRKAFEKLWGDLRGHRELLIGEKRKESGRGEKKKWVDMKSYVSSFRQLISLFVSFLSLCCSSLLASLFSFRFACGHHAAPPSRSSSSSSLWNEASSTRDGKVRSFFSSSYLSLHSPSSLNLPGMRRSSSERRIFHLDSRGTLPLSNPSPSSQRKKQGRKLFPRLSHMKAFPSRVHTEVARIERVLLAEEHRRLLRVNLGVMAQKFVAIEGEKFLLLSLLDSRAAGEYVFVSSAASILCRLLFAPIEEEAFNAFCSARQFEMTEREEGVMERDIQSFSSVEKDEEEKEKEKKKCKLMILGQQARGRDDMVKKIQSIEEERLKGEEEEEEKGGDYEKVSSLGRQEREIVDQGQNTWMKEPMLMYDGGRALERQKKQEEERRELIRNWGDKEKREGDGTSLHTGDDPGVDDVRKDDEVYVHRGGSDLIMCQEGNIRQDGLRWRKPRGEEGGKSSMARQFDCLQVDPQVHHPANCFSHLPNGGRRTTTPPLHEKKENRRCGREEEQQQPTAAPHPLLARTFNGDEEAVAGSPRAVRGDSSLCASSRGAKRRQIQTVYSRAERSSTLHTFPATRHEKGDRERERSLPDIPDVSMKSQSSVVWSKSLPLLRLLLLIEGTIGLVAATQGPIFARAALRLVYGPRWGNEPGAVAALQV